MEWNTNTDDQDSIKSDSALNRIEGEMERHTTSQFQEIGLAYLEITVQPQSKFRFRYKSEMTGKHGSLLGNPASVHSNTQLSHPSTQNGPKIYPTIKLHNFVGSALIRCSLVCDFSPHYPHAHILGVNHGGNGNSSPSISSHSILSKVFESESYVEGLVSEENDYTLIFQGLNIVYMGKKYVRKEILTKISQLEDWDARKIHSEKEINDLLMRMNLNMVSLYFEAFVQCPSKLQPICKPVISYPIQHNKSTQTSDLRIVRIDKYTSFCTGDEEVFILVEKVDKNNIQIKFYQENDKGIEIWKAYGKFTKLDVHHQYAIVFKTPPYRSSDIDTDVDVWLQLERPSDGATSQQIQFKYKPIERLRKMPRHQKPRNEIDGSNQGHTSSFFPGEPTQFSQGHSRFQNPESNTDNVMPGPSGSSVRQGTNQQRFPCDMAQVCFEPNQDKLNKGLALNVALSIGESLHSWAETSDFNLVLQKLRHLLCLVNENGDNALHTAILNEQSEPFMRILKTISTSTDISSIINETNLNGLTPLAMAVLLNAEPYVEQLLAYNADISIPNFEGDSPIHIAIKSNHINCLSLLLCSPKSYQVINRYNYNSYTPLHLGVSEGLLDAVDLLCYTKANVTCQEGTYGRTPLHIAVEKGSLTSSILLLKAAGDKELVNIQNYRGDTALHHAVSVELPNPALCALLLYFGADPMIENYIRKESEEGEVESGFTVFDLVTNDEILQILNSTPDQWEKVLKFCSNVMDSATRMDRDQLLSLDSLYIDSGIDIKST